MSTAKLAITPLSHVIKKQWVEGVNGFHVPVLYIRVCGSPRLVESLISYYLQNQSKSYEWRRHIARALGLFFDYSKHYVEAYGNDINHSQMIRKFGLAILNGTISPENPVDKMGLFWPPSTIQNAKRLINSLDAFIKWCMAEGLVSDKAIKGASPVDSEREYLKYLSIAMKVKDLTFLGHLIDPVELGSRLRKKVESRVVDFGTSTNAVEDPAKTFPNWLVPDLLQHGFVVDETATDLHLKEDITAKMITILLLFGGLRISEPFHLWFSDVVPQIDNACKVFLRHPSDSLTEIPFEDPKLRKQYLAERKLYPRNTQGINKSYFAGWKNLALDKSKQASVFFVHNAAEILFRNMYLYYLRYRSDLMKVYKALHGVDHPFLFVSKYENQAGAPYSIAAYGKALKRAYNRLENKFGYEIPRGKNYGTSPHGMRHFYGQTLIDAGIEPKIIQKSLHHRSVLSQSVYTVPKDSLVQKVLDQAKNRLDVNISETLSNIVVSPLRNE